MASVDSLVMASQLQHPAPPGAPPCLLAIDWGTSALRGALLDAQGRVLQERSSAQGILQVPANGFASVFEANFGDWTLATSPKASNVLISGMAGSRQGWREAAYCPCPAGFAELGSALCWLDGLPPTWPASLRMAIVPGLSTMGDKQTPDVMRGEEVQVFGALARQQPAAEAVAAGQGFYVLPGTHSKWVRVQDGRITGFRTCMTGEFYALLAQQSLLARSIDGAADLDAAAFVEGVQRATSAPDASLLATAFSVRTLGLFGRRTPGQLASLLSGLVIGEELRAMRPRWGDMRAIDLIGSVALCERYALALAEVGITTRSHGGEATWAGLHALARACGMMPSV